MPEVFVSIIVPNYNHAPFLEQRLESIFKQSYQNFEVILLDDYSIDDSISLLQTYASHPKVSHFIVNQKNSGSPFRQWQKGIALAKGDYIWIAESDDYCEPTFLEELIPFAQQGFDFVCCRSARLDETGKVNNHYFWADFLDNERWKKDFSNSGDLEVKNFMAYRNTIPNASACLFSKKDVDFPPVLLNMKYCGDWYFWVNFLQKKKIYYRSLPLNYYRMHTSTTRAKKDFSSEVLRYKEYIKTVKHARYVAQLGNIKPNESKMYLWMVEQISSGVTLKQLFSKNVFNVLKYYFWISTLMFKIKNRTTQNP